jgi:hypothetical protein
MDDATYASTHKWILGCVAIICLLLCIGLIGFAAYLLT